MSDILIQTLEQGHKQNPSDVAILKSLIDACISADKLDSALEYLQKLVVLDPKDINSIDRIIEISQRLNRDELITAYQALKSALNPSGETKSIDNNITSISDSSSNASNEETPKRVRGQKLTLVSDNGQVNDDDIIEAEDSHIYLKDVGGMHHVKKRLNITFLAPLKNPELVKKYGKKTSGGLILYGPPGCGKTFIARALAGELGAKFMSISLADVLDMYIGESERKLHEIFETARRNSPTVLFFDELDAIGQKRSNLRNSGMRTVVNQLLNEMDSVDGNNDGLFILAATNLPWDIDSAFKRPGRFDRVVAVFPPDNEARKHILEYHLRDVPCESLDLDKIVSSTELFSGADLAHLCQSAIDVVFEESLDTGEARGLTNEDFVLPLKEVKATTKAWFESARNYAMFANQSGAYDDLMNYIRSKKL